MLNERHYLIKSPDEAALIADAESLVTILQQRAEWHPYRIAYTFLEFGTSESRSLTYAELDQKVRQLAAKLQHLGMRGERALLLYPPGLDYIVAFFACLYAGAIAVPAYPPSNNRHMPRLQAILNDSQAKMVLSSTQVAANIRQFAGEAAQLLDRLWLATDALDLQDDWEEILPVSNDLAFLQYTSGSTGDAKGVMISHRNLMANQALIKRRFSHDELTTVVGWLPLYHDMGLIGNVMQPLYCGGSAVLMAPMAFLEKPLRWLQAISDYRAHTSGGPNFAYDLCAQKISRDDLKDIDLSCWQLAFNGAEPINPLTLQRFSDAFADCGFKQTAFYPCYGLAESTLLATGGTIHQPPKIAAFDKYQLEQRQVSTVDDANPNARHLVGCGSVEATQALRIVEPNSHVDCPAGRLGEIWLHGPSVAQGYWQNTVVTQKTFITDTDGQLWLRTGDLGFVEAGELFVSGRLKDLIIVRGRNYYPHDLEYAVESATDALNPASTVAFGVDEADGEKLIILAELKRNRLRQIDYQAEFSAIRTRLTEECGVQADRILLLKPGSILKTSSGKLRRSACREVYLQQAYQAVAADGDSLVMSSQNNSDVSEHGLLRQALLTMNKTNAASLLAQHLALKIAELSGLAVERIDQQQALTSLGLDSLKAVELKYFLDERLGIDLPISQLLGNASLFDAALGALELIGKEVNYSASGKDTLFETAMSYNQQALWTQANMHAGEALYHMPVVLNIHGPLDMAVLQRALAELCQRHPQLRTGFGLDANHRPVCLPLTKVQLWLGQIDCNDMQQRQDKLQAFIQQPFDLQHGPLLRTSVFSCGAEDHLLAFCAHHLIVDFRSFVVLLSELPTFYLAGLANTVIHLPTPRASYCDYVLRQQAYLQSERADQDLQFWMQQLEGVLPQLQLPGVGLGAKTPSMAAGAEGLMISLDVLARLKHMAAEHHTTLYTLLLSVFKTLLHRYSGQQDLIVGSPTLGRPMRQFADLVGYFVNPVALRTRPSGNLRFCDYLLKVDAAVLGALEHQCYPHALLIDKLRAEQPKGVIELYRTFFVLQDNADPIAAALSVGDTGINFPWAGLEANTCCLPETAEEFDLAVLAAETSTGLSLRFRYRSNVLMRETILHMLGHFQCLLHGVLADPNQQLAQLPLLTLPEQMQLLKWNATAINEGIAESTLSGLFEAQAERTPEAIALTFEAQSLSYADLNAKANQLAHYLITQGVGPDVLVGICIERSLEMVIGLLGILKAGGAYVPLDPHYPEDRIRYMLDDAGVELLLTRQGWAERYNVAQHSADSVSQSLPPLPADEGRGEGTLKTLCLDSDWSAIAAYSSHNPAPRNQPLDLAYIIYTSGSTGQPKGVAVSHRNAVHSTWARFQAYPDPIEAYLLLSSFAFDSSVAGIFWTLGQGGCLCLPGDDVGKDPVELAALIERHRISHLLALPSLYRLLLEQPVEQLHSLKAVIVAGEACATDVVQRHFDALPQTKLYNEYGPTEGTVFGGAGIVRGYLKRPDLTAERFIPDPFQADGGRVYKTGDLARYRADGAIEFLGRIDHQVKIRGFRIELGEIEAQLLAYADIKEAVVLAREDQPGDKRLVAYLVEEQLGTLTLDDLKAQLKQALPDYMVPSAFVVLAQMPLSANGKLDRKKLPVPDLIGQLSKRYVAPRTETEIVLAEIWREVLGVEQVGVEDDFFELGGHSLLATQLAFAVEKALGVKFPVKTVFERPTVIQQAYWLNGETDEAYIDLQAEAQLGSDILPLLIQPLALEQAQSLMLTGATGFLGAFLLADLLEQTQASVYCLIRANDESQALVRLRQQMARYQLLDRIDWRRVIPVCGDLATEHLGLSDERYREIAASVDAIFHNGALVNFVQPYRALKAANVLGSVEVLRLAATERPKAIHYVSTLSVFTGQPLDQRGFSENDEPLLTDELSGGYAQSKWVAEKLLRSASRRGFQVAVYRPATVAGDSRNGVWNTDDFICRLFKGCIQMGLAPDDDSRLDMAPVNFVSGAIVALALNSASSGRIFHLNHPEPPSSADWLNCFAKRGYVVRRVPYLDWLKHVVMAGRDDSGDFALASLLPLFAERDESDLGEAESALAHYDCGDTTQALAALGVGSMEWNDELMSKYMAYWMESGFMPETEYANVVGKNIVAG